MINENSLASIQCQQVLEMFSNYLNDMNFVINGVKKSIYEINNIQMPFSQVLVQPNVASLTVNGKKTLDDLKRIASILRGYSRSKNMQRQEDQTSRSRIQNSSISRSRSRISRYNHSNSSVSHSRISKIEGQNPKEQISMVTFQIPPPDNRKQDRQTDQLMARLRNYHSMTSLNKVGSVLPTFQTMGESYQTAKFRNTFQNGFQNSPIHRHIPQQSPMQRKRAQTFQKSISTKSMSRVITQTECKFKQCLQKHDSGMNDIIKRNSECLSILKDIHTHLKNKKNQKTRQTPSSPTNLSNSNLRQLSVGYKAMTPSTKKQQPILVR